MCVARPARVVWIGPVGDVSIPGRVVIGKESHEIELVMVPEARVGDYVITHSGYAIRMAPDHVAAGPEPDHL